MPTIVVCTVSRSHKMSKTQCVHKLCVEIGPPTPKTFLEMRRSYADLIVCLGRRFSIKSMQYVAPMCRPRPRTWIGAGPPRRGRARRTLMPNQPVAVGLSYQRFDGGCRVTGLLTRFREAGFHGKSLIILESDLLDRTAR